MFKLKDDYKNVDLNMKPNKYAKFVNPDLDVEQE